MHRIRLFKIRTYLFALIIVLILPGFGLAAIWLLFPPPNILQGFMWLLGEYAFWFILITNIPKLWGSNFQEWLHWDTLKILTAFEQSTNRTFLGIVDKLPIINKHINRKETDDILAHLRERKHVLISGESGSGKSGIAASIARDAVKRGIPVLFLETRQYSKSVNCLADLDRVVNVEKALITCTEKVAKQIGACLLIIDQLDSTIGSPASQASIELLAKASLFENVRVVAVGCVSKRPEYQPIYDLRFTEFQSKPIDKDAAESILHSIGISNPSSILLSITENLFYLSIILELASSRELNNINSEIRLLEEYVNKLEAAEGDQFIQTALELAYDKLIAGQINFTLPRMKSPATNRLIQRGVIVALGGNQFHFRHEQLHYFLFAKQVAEQEILLGTLLENLELHNVDTPLVFILKYLYANNSPMMKAYLDTAFSESSNLQFYDRATLLDEMISWQDLNSCKDKLFSFLRKEPYSSYFFKHLATSGNPAWFQYLKEEGFFSPSWAPMEAENPISYPRWPALSYLVAIAPTLSEDVVRIVEKIQIDIAFGMSALIGSFTKIPTAFAPRLVSVVSNWLDKQLPVAEELIDLIKYWVANREGVHALLLIKAVLKPQEAHATQEQRQSNYYSPKARFREFDYFVEKLIKELPDLPEISVTEILGILEANIIHALEIEDKQRQYEKASFWRSSIEPSSQNYGDRCKGLLLDTVIKLIDKLSPDQLSEIVDNYIQHSLSIFRRLAIHIIRTNKSFWLRYLENLYGDTKYWEDISYYHEYWLLTQDTFYILAPAQQQAYLNRLYVELERETSNEEEKQRSHYWVYRRLWAIKDQLPQKDIAFFETLRKEFEDPDPPEWFAFLSYSSSWTGAPSISSKTAKELAELSYNELLAELKKDFPPGRASFDEPTIEGLAMELETAVKDNPSRFASIALSLFYEEIHPLYVAHLIRGFRNAWKDKSFFDWEPVLELCYAISQTSTDLSSGNGTPADMLPGYWENTYGNARSAIVELLNDAINNDEHAIPHEHLDKVCVILLQLCNDLNPSSEYEANWAGKDNWDFLTLSLNVTRAKVVATLIHYALHRARIVKNDETAKDLLPEGSRIEPQVREKLTELLNKKLDPSKAVHVNFGFYLPNLNYLDREWLLAHLEDILPRKSEMMEYWQVAWEGYMWRSDFFASIYPDLKPYYCYATEQLEQTKHKEPTNTEVKLANHLAWLFAHGEEPFSGNNSLITRFHAIASDKLRGEFVKSLCPTNVSPPFNFKSSEWESLKDFWQQRHKFIQRQENRDNYKEELASFLPWVPHIPERLESFEEMIEASALVARDWHLSNLFDYLAKVVSDYPSFVINLYEKSLMRTDLQYFLVAPHEQILSILETAIHSEDQKARESAVRVINFYGARGNDNYRYLLKRP